MSEIKIKFSDRSDKPKVVEVQEPVIEEIETPKSISSETTEEFETTKPVVENKESVSSETIEKHKVEVQKVIIYNDIIPNCEVYGILFTFILCIFYAIGEVTESPFNSDLANNCFFIVLPMALATNCLAYKKILGKISLLIFIVITILQVCKIW